MKFSTPEKSPGTKCPYKTISPRSISTRLVSILVAFSMSVVNFHEIILKTRLLFRCENNEIYSQLTHAHYFKPFRHYYDRFIFFTSH